MSRMRTRALILAVLLNPVVALPLRAADVEGTPDDRVVTPGSPDDDLAAAGDSDAQREGAGVAKDEEASSPDADLAKSGDSDDQLEDSKDPDAAN